MPLRPGRRFGRRSDPDLGTEVIVGIIICAVILFIYGAVWLHKHPCIEWKQGTCGGGVACVAYDSDSNCMLWQPQPKYPCQVCSRRRP